MPVIAHYNKMTAVDRIDASGDPETVYIETLQILSRPLEKHPREPLQL
jgi:hypothetical protein